MLRRLRARAVDGATMLARCIDARRERDRLRETVDYVCDERDEARRERDEYARLVATREVEIDELLRLRREVERLTAERDARIPTDIDGAQEWAAKRGVLVQGGRRDTDWHCVVMSGEVVQRTNNRADAVHIAVWHSLHGMWRSDA